MSTTDSIIIDFNPTCSICKHFWIPDDTDKKSNGTICKTCKRCRERDKKNVIKNKCEHNKNKSRCKICGGGSFCIHNKTNSRCKICGGGGLCIHDRIKSACKDCKGSSICQHNRVISICKECNGSQICIHNRVIANCKDCKGSQVCEHNKLKAVCKDCKGSQICIHNKYKPICKICKGSQICEHNRVKYSCKDCGGKAFCIHNKVKSKCKDCGGASICIHNKLKNMCVECGGSSICEHNIGKSSCKKCNFKKYIIDAQRRRIYRCLKSSSLIKKNRSIEYLGCDADYLIEYFTKKMDLFNSTNDTKMTWDNIHIDHIKPISSFNIDDENDFNDCCHYTNLQPLLACDNLKKGSLWTEDNNIYWLKNIKRIEHLNIYLP